MATLTRGALEETGLIARRTPSGRRTCSPWVCCRGCTTGPPRARSGSCARSSPSGPTWPRRTCWRSRPGHAYGETTESFTVTYEVAPAPLPPGTYRQVTGNTALAYGIVAAGQVTGLPVFLGSYPITPASRHPARAEQAQVLRRDHLPGRGRDRRRRRRAGRVVRRGAGRDDDVRARDLAQERDDRPGGGAGAAAAGRRRAARRSVDGPAHQDRAGRPAAGDVRPQRRGAAADHRAAFARRLLRRRRWRRPGSR